MNPGAFSNEPKTIAKRRIELCRGSLGASTWFDVHPNFGPAGKLGSGSW